MSARAVIDSLEFARAGQELQGTLAVSGLTRLHDALHDNDGEVAFRLKGGRDGEQRPILILNIEGSLHLSCQRCLDRLDYPLRLFNTLLLARQGENMTESVADPDQVDYIEASTSLNVAELIEDEILLCLPLSPRHEEGKCPGLADPSRARSASGPAAFAGLAELKRILKSER